MKLETYLKYYDNMRATCVGIVPFSPEQGLKRVHEKCGCDGKIDCDCVSVVNQTHPEIWYEINTAHMGEK